MAIAAGTAAVIGGALALGGSALSSGSSLVSDVGSYFANKHLQELDHEFQRNEATLSRQFQAQQAQINRDWQTNANAVAMDFNASEAQKARDYNTYMSNTAHQRKMADLRAAGLNPILAASQGADTVAGASATGVAGNFSNPGAAASARGSTAHANINGKLDFKAIIEFVGDYLNSARKISQKADEFQHDLEMLELRQAHEKDMAERKLQNDYSRVDYERASGNKRYYRDQEELLDWIANTLNHRN